MRPQCNLNHRGKAGEVPSCKQGQIGKPSEFVSVHVLYMLVNDRQALFQIT